MPMPANAFNQAAPQTIWASPGPGARGSLNVPGASFLPNGPHPIRIPREHRQAALDQGWVVHDPQLPGRPLTGEEMRARQQAQERAGWRKIPKGAPLARVIGPLSGPFTTLMIEGRCYKTGQGLVQVVPAEDARILSFNQWTHLGPCGPTGSRPPQPPIGEPFYDTTLNAALIFDGAAWRDTTKGVPV